MKAIIKVENLSKSYRIGALDPAHATFREAFAKTIILRVWVFLTPIIYPLSIVPGKWRWMMSVNESLKGFAPR